MKTDEAVVVDVDLGIAPQCEHGQHHEPDWHGGDAKYVVQFDCGSCGYVKRFLLCEPAWQESRQPWVKIWCPRCCGPEGVWWVVSVL